MSGSRLVDSVLVTGDGKPVKLAPRWISAPTPSSPQPPGCPDHKRLVPVSDKLRVYLNQVAKERVREGIEAWVEQDYKLAFVPHWLAIVWSVSLNDSIEALLALIDRVGVSDEKQAALEVVWNGGKGRLAAVRALLEKM